LLKTSNKREQAVALLKEGKKRDEICKALNMSSKTLTKIKQGELEFDSNDGGEEML